MSTVLSAVPMIDAQRVIPFATTGEAVNQRMPEMTPISRLGLPGFAVYTHAGLNVPAATPADIVEKLNDALAFAMQSDAVAKRIQENGLIVPDTSAAAYAGYVAKETDKWAAVVKSIEFKRE